MAESWDDNVPFLQGMLIGYDQVRSLEEAKDRAALLKGLFGALF